MNIIDESEAKKKNKKKNKTKTTKNKWDGGYSERVRAK